MSTQFRYNDAAGEFHQNPAARLVVHMFNNRTHHRGRIQHIMMELGKGPPVLDFHILLRR